MFKNEIWLPLFEAVKSFLWSTSVELTANCVFTNVPSYIGMFKNEIWLPLFEAVKSFILTNWYETSSTEEVKTVPAGKDAVAKTESKRVTSIYALGALGDIVSYPKVFAWETTLERKDALSKNISFASIFIL